MIITDTVTINGKFFIRTCSNAGVMIERDGDLYSEAIDPIGMTRTYKETDIPIEAETENNYFENFSANP